MKNLIIILIIIGCICIAFLTSIVSYRESSWGYGHVNIQNPTEYIINDTLSVCVLKGYKDLLYYTVVINNKPTNTQLWVDVYNKQSYRRMLKQLKRKYDESQRPYFINK